MSILEAVRLAEALNLRERLAQDRLDAAGREPGTRPGREELERWKKTSDAMAGVWGVLERARGQALSRHPFDFGKPSGMDRQPVYGAVTLSSACVWRARAAMAEGKPADAAAALGDGMGIAESYLTGPGLFRRSGHLLAELILGATAEVLSSGPLPEQSLVAMAGRLEAWVATNRLFDYLVSERVMGITWFGRATQASASNSGRTPAGWFYSVSGLAAMDEHHFLSRMETLIEASRGPWAGMWKVVSKEGRSGRGWAPSRWAMLRGRALSQYWVERMAEEGVRREAGHVRDLQLAVIMLGVERYRLANGGRLPKTLDELVPAFLKSIPADPFEGRRPTYRVRGKTYELSARWKDGMEWFPEPAGPGGRPGLREGVLRVDW